MACQCGINLIYFDAVVIIDYVVSNINIITSCGQKGNLGKEPDSQIIILSVVSVNCLQIVEKLKKLIYNL